MAIMSSPMRTFSTRGIDLFVLIWDTMTEGAWLLNWESIIQATFGTHFEHPIAKCQLAVKGWVMGLCAAGAEMIVGIELEDVSADAQFTNPTIHAEGEVVGLEPFDRA